MNDDLRALHSAGLSSREIGRRVNLHHATVARRLGEIGLLPNGAARGILQIEGELARCTKCKAWRPLANFHVQRSGAKYPYRLTYCDACRRAQTAAASRRSLDAYMSDRLNRIRLRCAERNLPFDLSSEWAVAQYERQGGRCFYTDADLTHQRTNDKRQAISFDRVQHDGGYVRANVVLCSLRANTIKSDMTADELREWMPSWHARVAMWRAAGVPCFQVAPGGF